MDIVMCNDGSDILKYIFNESYINRIKYIITDENMELLNGSDAIKIVRFLESRKVFNRATIITLSCHEDFNIMKSFLTAGADYVLVKPLVKSALLKIFQR